MNYKRYYWHLDIDNTTNVTLVLAMIYTENQWKTDDVSSPVKVLARGD